jgi:hypothetical protein
MIKIQTGGMTLLESTTFLAVGLGETRIKITSETESLTFVLFFAERKADPLAPVPQFQPEIKWEAVNPNELRIELTNWVQTFPATLLQPVRVGTFSKRQLYVLFAIAKLGSQNEIRQVTFSTYLGEEVPDGQA